MNLVDVLKSDSTMPAEESENAKNDAGAVLPFNPRIYLEPGLGEVYDDGRVLGAVSAGNHNGSKTIVVHEWSSRHPSQGHSKQALTWLRSEGFVHIVANGVGLIEEGVGDISTAYWQHMHELGLVDVLLDDDGQDITSLKQCNMPSLKTRLLC